MPDTTPPPSGSSNNSGQPQAADLDQTVVPEATVPSVSPPTADSSLERTSVPLDKTDVGSSGEDDSQPVKVRQTKVSAGETRAAQPGKSASGSQAASGAAPKKKGKVTKLGDFQLIKKLGKGGMGEVYLAKQISLDRLVAIKTLTKELAKREDFVSRFQREARAMAKLHHPNAVAVYAVDSYKGLHYAAIEYVDGQSMQDWMNQLGKLSVGDALHVAILSAEALSAAHQQNMVHRDIKPDNILVTKSGVVKVADFGLAKALDEDVSMTQSGTGLGTPLYMAPEQARNAKHVDHRTDIYALGATLYYFVTGELPYKGENAIELITAKEKGKHTPARKLNPEISERLDLMIDKMLAKSPDHRYKTCEEVITDLESLSLANAQLGFIDAPQKARMSRQAAVRPSQVQSSASSRPMPTTSRDVAESQVAEASKTEAAGVWFVRHRTPSGMTISKLSLHEIGQQVKAGKIDLGATAKETADGQWVPIAQIPQLADVIAKRQVSVSAQQKSKSLKSEFAALDKAHAKRNRFRWLKGLGQGAMSWVMFAVMLAVGIAVCYGIYYVYINFVHQKVQEMIGG